VQRRGRENDEKKSQRTHLPNRNPNLRLSRVRATMLTTMESNGTGTTINFASFSVVGVGRRSRGGWGS